MNSLLHHPVLLTLAILVGIIVYGNIAWMYIYILRKKNWFSDFLHFFGKKPNVLTDWETFSLGFIWPLAFAISILCWFVWLTFGGIARTLVGKDLDGKPLTP